MNAYAILIKNGVAGRGYNLIVALHASSAAVNGQFRLEVSSELA
jgi:hypothetical protein